MAPRPTSLLVGALLLTGEAQAGALLGVDWAASPQNEALNSTLVVGEFDGILRPRVNPYGGWRWGLHQVTGTIGIALFSTQTEEGKTRLGNLRLGLDYRYTLLDENARLWLGVGAYQLFPLLLDENSSYSESEKGVSETQLSEQKAQLAGSGFRVGLGVEIPISEEFRLGFHHHWVDHLNFISVNESTQVNALIYGETGIHGQVEF